MDIIFSNGYYIAAFVIAWIVVGYLAVFIEANMGLLPFYNREAILVFVITILGPIYVAMFIAIFILGFLPFAIYDRFR